MKKKKKNFVSEKLKKKKIQVYSVDNKITKLLRYKHINRQICEK